MNFAEFESAAGRLLQDQRRLRAIDAELDSLSQEIKQDPKRNEKDRAFYALIGMDWSDPGHKASSDVLRTERDAVQGSIRDSEASIFAGMSQPLVVPLDPVPVHESGRFTFKFRSGATFPNTVDELSVTLGIPSPLKMGEVTIYPDQVVVVESDEYFAKKKVVEAFDDIRKALRLKLAP